jgi:sulfur relay (sulfurtransferase) DsrF/TusC family protein
VKDVVVAVRSSPLTTGRVHEALRMALGLTLSNHRVTVAYAGAGAGAALTLDGTAVQRPGLAESLDLFDACRIRELVEIDALPPPLRGTVRARVEPVDRSALVDLFAKADVVIPW